MFMKRIGEKRRLRNLVAAVSVGLIAGAFSILPVTEANPVLDSKGAAVSIAGTTDMSITSTAANNVIKWIDFSIGAGEKVAFDGHNYLNYVTGHARSDILGTLTGGGSIYIVNPNGILIGDGAQVNVGSLYLSTRNLTTEQLAGFDTAAAALFKTDSLSGDVINMGKLNADVISVEGNNITFKNTADVSKNGTLNNEGQLTGGTVNQAVNLWADGGEIHIGSAGGSASGYTVNNGTEIDYRLVKNVADLQNMSGDGNYMLAMDISSATINPINNHTGRFDGLNHTLSNLTINLGNSGYGGLFRMNNGTVENLEINGITFTNAECAFNGIGAFVGINDTGTIKNVRNTGSMVFSIDDRRVNTIGGIVGINNANRTIENVYNTAEISYGNINSNLGGIAGINYGKIVNTFNSGRLDAGNASQVGGIAGANSSTIENAYNIGTVTGNQDAGGIAGYNGGTLSYTYNTGTVNGIAPEPVDFNGWTIDKDGTNNTAAWRQYGNNAPILKAFLARKDNYIGEVVYNGAETGDVGTNYYMPTLTSTQEQGIDWASDVAIVTPKTLTVENVNKSYDGTDIATIKAANLSGVVTGDTLTVSTTSANYADKNAATGKTVTYTGLTLSGEKAKNYSLAKDGATTGTITAKEITATFADISKTYDGTTSATAGTGTLSGVISGDTVTVTGSAAFEDKNVGTDKTVNYTSVALSGEEAGNYTIANTATGQGAIAAKSITATFADISKTYDGTNTATAGAGTLNGVEAVDTGKVSVTASAAYADKNAGTNKQVDYTNVALTGDEAGNYTIASTATGNGTITAKNITVSFGDISKIYDGTTSATAGAGTLNGVEDIDSGKVSVSASAAYADKNAGTNKQVDYTNVILGGDEAGNYIIAAATTGTGVITPKAITATFADISKTYDGTTSATAGAGTLNGVEDVDTGKVSVTANAAYVDKNVGTGKQVDYTNVTLTGAEAGNYSIADTATGKGQIDRANLTVSVKDYSREYDGTMSAGGAELQVTSGTLYAGDTISGGTKVFDTKDVGTGKTITVSEVAVKDSAGNANNYNISYAANTNSAITPKTLTVLFADISKTYDGTVDAAAGAGTLQGVVAGEDVTLQDGIAAVYDSKNAGNRTVNYSGIAISGADIGNYTIAATGTGTGVINPKELTASFGDISKTYDGTTSAVAGAGTLDGVVAVDTGKVSVTASAAYADKNAGTNKQVDYTNVALTGDEAGNYTIAGTATGNGTITAKNITVSFGDISKTYDGTTDAAAGTGTLQGVVSGDDVGLQDGIAAVYDSKNAGNRTVNYSGIAISGADIGNYTIAATGTGTGVINPKELTVGFGDISKTYDGTITATAGEGTLTGVEAIDTGKVSVTASAAYVDKNAGTGKQVDYSNVALTGTESGNYSIADTATGKGQIDRANLTVSVKDYSREYDGTMSAGGAELQVTSGTLYAGDSMSGGNKTFDTKGVGNGKTITVSEVTVKDSTGNANNYNISYVANTNNAITPKTLTASFATVSKTYDGTTDAVAGEGTLQGVVVGEDVTLQDGIAAVYDSKNAGNRTVNYSGIAIDGADKENYTIAATGTGTGVINPKELTVSFADISKTYDGTITATAGEGTLTGVEAIDTGKVSVMASAAYADKNAGTDKQVDYSNVTLTGDEAGNYSIANTATGNGQIDRANLTVSVKDYSREYDGTVNADGAELTVTSGTLYAGDTISGGTKTFDTKDVGTGKTITVSGVSINDGNNGDNYAVTYQPNTNSVITALPQPEPVNPQPSNPEPVNTEPSQEQQLAETGNAVADIESATEKLGTEEVHEMKEKMAAPKHEALEVTDEKSGDDENEKKQSKK